MKPYFRVTWNVLKYNLIKFFKCKNIRIWSNQTEKYKINAKICRKT